jgi:hypothetical protein
MAKDFLTAIMERTGEAGFDTQYSKKYQTPELEKRVANLKAKQEKIAGLTRKEKPKTRAEAASRATSDADRMFADYDQARQSLIDFFGSTLNTPKGVEDKNKVIADIVNQVSRENREAGYKTEAAPAAAPAATPAAAPAAAPAPMATQAAPPAQAAPAPERAEMTEPAPQQSRRERRDERLERKFEREGVSTLSDMAGGAEFTPVADTETPAAFTEKVEPPKPSVSEERMSSLFKTSTGTPFNPQSRVDKARMAQLRSFVESNPDVLNKSDVGASLAFYRTLK